MLHILCIRLLEVFIALTMLPYKADFGYLIGFWGSADFDFGNEFSPESLFGADLGFKFGFRF